MAKKRTPLLQWAPMHSLKIIDSGGIYAGWIWKVALNISFSNFIIVQLDVKQSIGKISFN